MEAKKFIPVQKKEEVKVEEKIPFELVQVPASYTLAVKCPDDSVLSLEDAVIYLMNELERVKQRGGF